MITIEQQKLLDETTNKEWRKFVHPSKIEKPKVNINIAKYNQKGDMSRIIKN